MENESKMPRVVKLRNGIEMPLIGLGTYKLEDIENSVKSAVKSGYRLFDTASLYNNEKEVGQALNECIQEGIVKREDLFVVTKLWNDDHEDPVAALKASLSRLNMEYVDLFIIHWPIGKVEGGKLVKQIPLYKTWGKMEQCVELGLAKSIGVSNFNVQLLLDLTSYANIPPVCNQIELHPYLSQEDLVQFCFSNNIIPAAYNPLARGSYVQRKTEVFEVYDLFKNSVILELAEKYKKEPAQIILNWHTSRNICAIPKSSNPSRQLQNLESLNFKMTDEDYQKVFSLNQNLRFNASKEKPFAGGIELFA